ncbi:conserved hypothetical protein [Theileria orientalis strain Shintoku]|uniref:DOT1 domain-containing protein n=1 Tax=Theileria orientalis strain Shintoku TaxID=869250 RepID=J4CDD4_THEOR|nr:conserved hypothetical protein [Theileria orientalis strain Shintoku]PVC52972.1 hypothetical protein MACL_00000408 [Theileria orientalis]BAM40947.1 conserved hypothetical protein [Theileria orientalis strain Shintoku]|eukprot:XP_009691248.1 conserved hypothetical protein [Theileria orientalis strain Shintoku]
MRCAESQLSTSPTTKYRSKSPNKNSNSPVEYDICTPVRTVKRSRPSDEITNYVDHVESEFYRVYSDRSSAKRFKGDSSLSFLFRGPTNDIITSTVGMYGEIAHSSLKVVCKKMVEFGLDEKSVLLDLGSGRGVPNFVFASDANIFSSIGIEKCPLAYMNSVNNICAFIARDIKGIRTEIEETPSRSLSDLSECSTSSDGEGSRKSCKTLSSSTDYAPSSPGKTNSDYSDMSISTQLEEDEYNVGVFNENAETPKRFLRAPKMPNEVDLEELQQGLEQFKNKQSSLPIAFVNEDIIAYDAFEGVTHFYSFDIAMERALINNMVYQFMNTSTAYVFGSFISDLMVSFGLKDCFLGAKVPCRMYGSNEGKTCYIYVKNNWRKIKAKADAKIKRALGPQKKVKKPRKKKATNKQDSAVASLKKLTFDVNNFSQPYRAMDIIKLSKLPLYHQYSWYLSKLDKFYSRSVTRSYSDNLKESLASERDALIEQIAHKGFENSHEERAELKTHIATHYRKVSRFPEPL